MPKGSPELAQAREREIVDACAALYATRGFREITIKDIGEATSFTRTSIYNYFQTKEEIFLALMGREFSLWTEALHRLMAERPDLSPDEFARALATTLEERPLLLKILATDRPDLEAHSRQENLVAFKRSYGATLETLDEALAQYVPALDEADRQGFILAFVPFLFGVYPQVVVTERQQAAMEEAGMRQVPHTVSELVYACATRLLGLPQRP